MKKRKRKTVVSKRRLSISLPVDIANQLEELATINNESLNAIIVDKLTESIETDEDAYWLKLVKGREKQGQEYISHEDAWKNIQ